jgi:RND superfamily putative drug exporter
MGLVAAVAAVIAVLAVLTLLSAVLAVVGTRIDAPRVRPSCSDDRACPGLWARWAGGPGSRGSRWLGGCGNYDPGPAHHRAVLLRPGPAGCGGDGQVDQKDLAARPGIVAITPMRIDRAGTAAYFTAISRYGPSQNTTADLIDTLRSTVVPKAGHGTNMGAEVGGGTTAYEAPASTTSATLPLQIMALIALSFALLILAFGTVVIPAQAAVANVFSIAAAYGVLTAIFQFGWLSRLVELTGSVPILSSVPPLMFAILFGLSVDDEVFLVRQLQRHVHAGEDNNRSVIGGLVTSARVSASALIMVFVFGSFLLNGNPPVTQFGVGLAVAVILDATVMRGRLVRAPMILLGPKNWYLPRWIDRLAPHFDSEGSGLFDRPRHPAPARRVS